MDYDANSSSTLVVGDTHLKQKYICAAVDVALQRYRIDEVIFTGDYGDDWLASDEAALIALRRFAQWIETKRREGMSIRLVLGNHDLCYLKGVEGPGTQFDIIDEVCDLLERFHVEMAVELDGFLITHAGITQRWIDEYMSVCCGKDKASRVASAARLLNEMFADQTCWDALDSCGSGRGGWDIPGPLWADLWELKADPALGIDQIVGHTPVAQCVSAEIGSNQLWFCDTFSLTSALRPIGNGGMLLVSDGKAEVLSFKQLMGCSWAETMSDYFPGK